ncbi:MAG: pyruvate dehydrogenase complex dihydrolipoamide acetyltransferase [Alphaproteobacteria bacterium]|nr:pyruvate dehydrogenase complex dihydrolipoamide acetyltransferase [Alphaproteobacteria bacterium]
MPIKILMPALSPTMTEGNLAKWVKKEGEKISAGEVIAEIETDKATMEVEAVDEGIIAKILIPEGTEGVQVNSLIAVLVEGDEGDADVEAFIAKFRDKEEYCLVPNNNMRKVIAKRLLESKLTVPHFYLSIECVMDSVLNVRAQINANFESDKDKRLSVNDFIILACGKALKEVPAANASWTDSAIMLYNNVDISVAVAIEGGLITPIIKNADQKDIVKISSEMKDLAKRARENALAPEEFQGGGFSISNLGMYGIKSFSAIVNPPQGCIMAVGMSSKRPVIIGDKVEIRTIMDVTLSCDHRVVDGAVGAEFLAAFKKYIEAPILMFV